MSEGAVVQRTRLPATLETLKADLSTLGARPDVVLLVHSSLRALGWICGGAVAVIQATQETIDSNGTLVMLSCTGGADRSQKLGASFGSRALERHYSHGETGVCPLRTPTRQMGQIDETFRTWPNVVRSTHPHCSFAAWGAHAAEVVEGHELENGLGEGSPLARIYELDDWVLLLGLEFASNSSLHLAEYRASHPGKAYETNGAPMLVDGERRCISIRDLVVDADDFPRIGRQFKDETETVRTGKVGQGAALLMPQRPLVDYAVAWMETHRIADSGCEDSPKRQGGLFDGS